MSPRCVCPPPTPCPQVQGDNAEERDAGAVQRGDPEMEQKMNRVLRGCIESGGGNPICSIHDQGAGGNGTGTRGGDTTHGGDIWGREMTTTRL